MITPGLERVIQMGKARAHTFTFGAGASGRIPCPQNSFLIIHHFDYWHFLDIPPNTSAPAIANVVVDNSLDPTLVDNGNFDFGIWGNFAATLDFTDPAATLLSVQTGLTALHPGWTVTLLALGAKFEFQFTTTTPGAAFNGAVATYIPTAIIPPLVIPGVFAGGINDTITLAEILTHRTHQLEFRSKKSRNHFEIQEPVKLMPYFDNNNGLTQYHVNVGGFYPKDCYLVHTEPVQINVVGVPGVENWGITFLPPSDKSQENPFTPGGVGYGVQGFPSASVVRQVLFDGITQQYLPLTSEFDTIAPLVNQYSEQFKVKVNAANALFNPQNVAGGFYVMSAPTYPLINIDYIQVDMNYNDFVKASS